MLVGLEPCDRGALASANLVIRTTTTGIISRMAISIHPRPGQLLMCDFSKGFSEPEMVKVRPVLVLTPSMDGRSGLVTVVGLSTEPPAPPRDFHCVLPRSCLPQLGNFQSKDTWVKGDMVYSVGFHRLDLIKLGKRGPGGKREYFTQRLGRDRMREVYSCVLHGLSFGSLVAHLPE